MGDIAMCFATLSYLFQHIWTNLLTQCPSASFCLLLSVHCRLIPIFKVLRKFHTKYIQNQRFKRLQKPEGERPRQEATWLCQASPGALLRPMFSPRSVNP